MSTKYKKPEDVPTEILCKRLEELVQAVTEGTIKTNREFTMRVPAELDRDADLVLLEVSKRLKQFDKIKDRFDIIRQDAESEVSKMQRSGDTRGENFYQGIVSGVNKACIELGI